MPEKKIKHLEMIEVIIEGGLQNDKLKFPFPVPGLQGLLGRL